MEKHTVSTLDRLKQGIRSFQREVYAPHSDFYRRAGTTPQKPHTLIITCADSRIDIETVTHAQPGELFINRNVGNLVPAYGEMQGGVGAVIEYAIDALKVNHVVVCGHSDCGAMKALQNPASLATLPTVERWLHNAHAASTAANSLAVEGEEPLAALRRLTERNVLLQVQHLHTHPAVAGAVARGELTLSGWVYNIATGEVSIAEDGSDRFETVTAEGAA